VRRRFGAAGPFWGRQYLFWHGGKPLTLIYEVFSTELERLLGRARMV
jgi:chorismate lyase